MRKAQKVLAVTLAAATLLSLAACSPYKDIKRTGGISEAQVEQVNKAPKGIEKINFYNKSWYQPGEGDLFSSRGMDIHMDVVVKEGYSIRYTEQFLKWAAQSAWSVNSKYPKGKVVITVQNGISNNYDWHKEVKEIFNVSDYSDYPSDGYSSDLDKNKKPLRSVISLPASAYGQNFGRWPGKQPVFKDGIISLGVPKKILPYAIDNLETRTSTINTNKCYVAAADRNNDDTGNPYPGDVTIEMFYNGEPIDKKVSTYDFSAGSSYKNYINFSHCVGDKSLDISKIKFKFTTEDTGYFEPVNKTVTFEK
jgi:hypothetical protein